MKLIYTDEDLDRIISEAKAKRDRARKDLHEASQEVRKWESRRAQRKRTRDAKAYRELQALQTPPWMKGDKRICDLCGHDGNWHAEGNNNISSCRGYSPPEDT